MSVFAAYAQYYDLLYRDKPYREESDYVRRQILTRTSDARSIVELGCGTGAHAEYLARAGFEVHGSDISDWMLQRAQARRSALPDEIARRLHFSAGDARTLRLGVRADAVISLFHVMSYQTSNDDLRAAFATAREHLRPGGVFLFDCWYGPAVLTDPPVVRVKELENDEIAVTRIAQPGFHPQRNLVDVSYRIIVRDKKSGLHSELLETHTMRYLFATEVELLAAQAGLAVADSHEWLTQRRPGFDTWGVTFLCLA